MTSTTPSLSSAVTKKAVKPTRIVNSKIIATSETSRFHIDTITTLSTEIDLKQVSLAIDNVDLIIDAHLRLKAGVHYALSGRNGEGKSVLLQAIADKLIPGIAENMRILLVTQIVEANSPYLDLSIVQSVIQADARRESVLKEYEVLSKGLGDDTPQSVSFALATVLLARATRELEGAQKVASKRSGTRGADARKALLAAEGKELEARSRLSRTQDGEIGETDAAVASSMLVELESVLEVLGASTVEARACSILLGLGFRAQQLDEKLSTLSGGWRSRCALAGALLQTPDLLILDEPTNYLDILSVVWLQEYLNEFSGTLLLVAHDRDFVDNVAQELIVLRHQALSYYDGNLTAYERDSRRKRRSQAKLKDTMDRKKEAIERTIEQAQKNAKKTGDETLARMAKSRQKKLDERWGVERSAKGGRFKLNRDAPGYHLSNRMEVEVDQKDRDIHLTFPNPATMRFPGALISATGVSFSYSRAPSGTPVLTDVSLTILPGSRTALVGRNGEGKSTLLKLLIGTLSPIKGTVERHSRLRIGYFDQLSVERLSSPEISKVSALTYFIEALEAGSPSVQLDEGSGRRILGSFGLGGRKATDPIVGLSGGQKVRLALATIVTTAPDLLVLDEPSTHLDIDTIAALIIALRKFAGAVLLVSHDRHLVRCLVERKPILPVSDTDEEDDDYNDSEGDDNAETGGSKGNSSREPGKVYKVGPKGRVKVLAGGMDAYTESMEKMMKKLTLA